MLDGTIEWGGTQTIINDFLASSIVMNGAQWIVGISLGAFVLSMIIGAFWKR